MRSAATTWHYGLIARWWSLFRLDRPEVVFFRRYVEAGEPVLELACGTGRLLVRYVRDGFDVDGTDVSADMLAYCRAASREVGAEPALYAQPTHELDLPRSCETIFFVAAGLVSAVRRTTTCSACVACTSTSHRGMFVFDYEIDEFDSALAALDREPPTGDEPPPDERERGPDGDDYALRHRMLHFDARTRRGTRELQAWRWHDGELVTHERHELRFGAYTSDQVGDMTRAAGFAEPRTIGGYDGEPVGPQHEFAVIEARRPR